MNRQPIFAAVRTLRGGKPFTLAEVALLDRGIDEAIGVSTQASTPSAPTISGRTIGPKGVALIQSFESCKLEAYPDPGSADGNPWTIGWGSTGPAITRGVRWTQAQCDNVFANEIAEFAAKVDKTLAGVPTNQNQFDAMCSLAYNIGSKAFSGSTVLRKHKEGDYLSAARAFLLWNKNDGKVMRGLTRRRLAESDLYDDAVQP